VISKSKRYSLIVCSLVCSCAQGGDSLVIEKERGVLESKICSAMKLGDAEASLKSSNIEYSISANRSRLNAIKHYESRQLVSSAIVIELTIRSEKIETCKVRVVHTGP